MFNQSTRRLGDRMSVRTDAKARGRLGYLDERTGEIVIRADQPHVQKCIILLHELLHAVDAQLVGRVTKRRASHDWITHAAPNLLAALSALDVQIPPWRAVRKFMLTMEAAPERRPRKKGTRS
jgi:hypothetical protein